MSNVFFHACYIRMWMAQRITIRFRNFYVAATRKELSKSGPSTWCFDGFGFQIVLAPQRGANIADLNFYKGSEPASLNDFDFRTVLAILATSLSKFCGSQFQKMIRPCHVNVLTVWTSEPPVFRS